MGNTSKIYLPALNLPELDSELEYQVEESLVKEETELKNRVLPELEYPTLSLIEKRLGYIPRHSVTVLYEPSLRFYYHGYINDEIHEDRFYFLVDELLKVMRKYDLMPENRLWGNSELIQNYCKAYRPHIQNAQTRIYKHLGYEPEQKFSQVAEIWMSQLLAKDTFYLPDHLTPYDYRAMTCIKYRELWMTEGELAANDSLLLAMLPID